MVKRALRCKAIINACSPACSDRAGEIAAFLEAHSHITGIDSGTDSDSGNSTSSGSGSSDSGSGSGNGRVNSSVEALVFYSEGLSGKDLVRHWPFQSISLVKVRHYQPETILAALQALEEGSPADLYLFSGDMSGNELAVRFASRLNGSSLVAVEKLDRMEDGLIGIKKVYSGNLSGSFLFKKKPFCLSLARGMEKINLPHTEQSAALTFLDYSQETGNPALMQYRETSTIEQQPLDKARFIFAVGRGAGSSSELERLETIAHQMGAALGVSRPVAMNAWAPLNRLIGTSGKVVTPEICLCLAVSGSPPFYYGIEKSKIIVAINTDGHAPLIKAADLAIIEDYKEVIRSLVELFENDRNCRSCNQ